MTRLAITIESPRAPGVAELLRAGEMFSAALYPADENFFLTPEELEEPGVTVFVGRMDTTAVGMAALVLDGESAELKRLFVSDLARGRGVAGGVLDALEEHARGAGARVIRLETGNRSDAALALYEKRGYRLIPRFGPYIDSESSLCMELPL
ncbi:MAG: GNAT family N-acetyltransferase [Salinibacterium sp.]|nr:GNAT family N-acetyltransferase [Salinibacterium sp.]